MKINFLVLLLFLLAQSITPSGQTQAEFDKPSTSISIPQPQLKWQNGGCFDNNCATGWYSSPAVADLNKDGKTEVIGAAYSLFILDGKTGVISSTLGTTENRIWPDVVVADLNHDGQLEIVTADGGGVISVYHSNGTLMWSKPVPTVREVRSLAVSDLDGDGNLEIIAASTAGSSQWMVYRWDGSSYSPNWPQLNSSAGNAAGCYNENIAAGDLNGDGRAEIIGPNDTHYIDAFNDNGTQVQANSIFGANKYWSQVGVNVDQAADLRGYTICGVENRPNFANSAPILADLLGNGTLQVVVVGNVYNCVEPYTDLYQMPFIFNANRTRWQAGGYDWTVIPSPDSKAAPLSEDYNKIENAVPNPVAADLDGDGHLEILYPSYDGRMHAYWLDKTEHGNWPYSVYQKSDGFITFASEPVVADLNGDGKAEVIFTSWT